MDEVTAKLEMLLGMLRNDGELYLSDAGRRGLYSVLVEISDALAGVIQE